MPSFSATPFRKASMITSAGGAPRVKGPTALGGGEIEAQAALVAIDGEVKNALATSRDAVHGASGIRRPARFHLDDVGAHVRQIHAADRACNQMRQLEHADPFERRSRWSAHGRINLPHGLPPRDASTVTCPLPQAAQKGPDARPTKQMGLFQPPATRGIGGWSEPRQT